MARELDLWYHCDPQSVGMTDDTLDLLLSIVATISSWSTFIDEATILLPPLVPIALGAESSLLRQQRILL